MLVFESKHPFLLSPTWKTFQRLYLGKGLLYPETGGKKQEVRSHTLALYHLNLFEIWTGDWARHVATPAASLSHSPHPRRGPLGYVIFLSDILGIVYDSFLEHELLNSFPMEEFLLS